MFQVILPEGAHNVVALPPFESVTEARTERFTFLDSPGSGRPVVILKMKNVVKEHNVMLKVSAVVARSRMRPAESGQLFAEFCRAMPSIHRCRAGLPLSPSKLLLFVVCLRSWMARTSLAACLPCYVRGPTRSQTPSRYLKPLPYPPSLPLLSSPAPPSCASAVSR